MEALIQIFIVIALLLLLATQIYNLRKVARIDRTVWSMEARIRGEIMENFRQFEALHGLYWDLKPGMSLPPTRGWAGSPDFLKEVASHILNNKPATIVECSSGVSSIVIAWCLRQNGHGHAYSLEHAPEYADATRKLLVRNGLDQWVTIIDAPLIETTTDLGKQPWYDISGLDVDRIDTLVIDGPPANTARLARYPAGPILFNKLSAIGTVLLDDANRPDEREMTDRWMAAFGFSKINKPLTEKGLVILQK